MIPIIVVAGFFFAGGYTIMENAGDSARTLAQRNGGGMRCPSL
jgi:hypothetical protein